MTSFDRFERSLPALLDELSVAQSPDYIEDILARTVATRQRPGWAFPERWLPMSALTRRLATVPRVQWRLGVALALLVVAGLIAALVAGSFATRRPAPFGPAVNGQIVFIDPAGRVVAGDPVSGKSSVLVAEPGNGRPVYSQDGTRLAFTRAATNGLVNIMVAAADGTHAITLTPKPIAVPGYVGWSPSGDSLLISDASGTVNVFSTSRAAEPTTLSGKPGLTSLEIGYSGYNDRAAHVFRPPNGDELLFVNHGRTTNLVAVKPDGTGLRTLLDAAKSPLGYGNLKAPQWSPDGSQVVVMVEVPGPRETWHLYVMNADGTNVHPLSALSTNLLADQGSPMWSPDGKRIAFQHWLTHTADDGEDFNPIGIVDVATGTLHDVGPTSTNGFVSWDWSPDGTSILEVPGDGTGDILITDAATGLWKTAPWRADQPISWQRTAS